MPTQQHTPPSLPHPAPPAPANHNSPTPTPTPEEEEAALLEHFNRYMLSEDAAPEPFNSPTPHALNPSATPFTRLVSRYPNYDTDVLHDVLASCDNDDQTAIQLLADAPPVAPVDDHRLAVSLQNRENTRLFRHRRNDANIKLEPGVLQHMVATLREIVVPALCAHFEELVLPDWEETNGNVVYALRDFQVSAFSLPPQNIIVKAAADGASIRVHVVNVYLQLRVGRWSYESKGFVPVRDAGTATATVHGLSVDIRLEPRWSHSGGTRVHVAACDVRIDGVVRLKTSGAAADWAYNAMAVVLKPLVVSYIKNAVSDTVTKALGVHLTQWALSAALDDHQAAGSPPQTSSAQPPVMAE